MRARWILVPLVVLAAAAATVGVYMSTLTPKPKVSAVASPEQLCAEKKGTLVVNPDEKSRCPKDTHPGTTYPHGRVIAVCCEPNAKPDVKP